MRTMSLTNFGTRTSTTPKSPAGGGAYDSGEDSEGEDQATSDNEEQEFEFNEVANGNHSHGKDDGDATASKKVMMDGWMIHLFFIY